jgi:hypothetical protein
MVSHLHPSLIFAGKARSLQCTCLGFLGPLGKNRIISIFVMSVTHKELNAKIRQGWKWQSYKRASLVLCRINYGAKSFIVLVTWSSVSKSIFYNWYDQFPIASHFLSFYCKQRVRNVFMAFVDEFHFLFTFLQLNSFTVIQTPLLLKTTEFNYLKSFFPIDMTNVLLLVIL